MFAKLCPYCSNKSYSATGKGKWRCPYCGKDLTNVDALSVDGAGNGGVDQDGSSQGANSDGQDC